MQFVVTGMDGTDAGAFDRRMENRAAHLEQAKVWYEQGKWLYAAGVLNEKEQLCGSVIICEFSSEVALRSEWLEKEPYVLGKVWETIDIKPAMVPPFMMGS